MIDNTYNFPMEMVKARLSFGLGTLDLGLVIRKLKELRLTLLTRDLITFITSEASRNKTIETKYTVKNSLTCV